MGHGHFPRQFEGQRCEFNKSGNFDLRKYFDLSKIVLSIKIHKNDKMKNMDEKYLESSKFLFESATIMFD